MSIASLSERGIAVPEQERFTRPKSVDKLPDYVASLSPEDRERWDSLFKLRVKRTSLVYNSEQAAQHIAERFGGQVIGERIVMTLKNIVWGERTNYNTHRANLPGVQGNPADFLENFEKKYPLSNCDFEDPDEKAPQDEFGPVIGKYTRTVANPAPHTGRNSIIIFTDRHNPHGIDTERFVDATHTAIAWHQRANQYNPEETYPMFYMNINPRAGASQPHPHAHVSIDEEPDDTVGDYSERMAYHRWVHGGESYFDRLVKTLEPMGLVIPNRIVDYIINPVPIRAIEVIIRQRNGEALPSDELAEATWSVIECYRSLGLTSQNILFYLPQLRADVVYDKWRDHPYVRIVDRGPEGKATSDMGALEAFRILSVAGTDPFRFAEYLKDFLRKSSLH